MCEFCEQGEDVIYENEWGGCVTVYIDEKPGGNFLCVDYACNDDVYSFDVSTMIIRCPMCGRKLGGGE